MSQTLCRMDVFPAFDLPMMSTRNWIFGTRGESGGTKDRAEDDAGTGAGPAGDRAGDDAGAGYGDGSGSRKQVLCFSSIV